MVIHENLVKVTFEELFTYFDKYQAGWEKPEPEYPAQATYDLYFYVLDEIERRLKDRNKCACELGDRVWFWRDHGLNWRLNDEVTLIKKAGLYDNVDDYTLLQNDNAAIDALHYSPKIPRLGE